MVKSGWPEYCGIRVKEKKLLQKRPGIRARRGVEGREDPKTGAMGGMMKGYINS